MRPGGFRPAMSRTSLVTALVVGVTVLLVAGAVFFRLNLSSLPETPKKTEHFWVGRSTPPYELLNLQENLPYTSHDFIGKVVLLNFWATWCPPCLEEMPKLEALWKRHKDDPRFRFAAVNCDAGKTAEAIKKFVKEHNWSMPVYTDLDQTSRRLFEIEGLPTTILIDRNSIVRCYYLGMREGGVQTVEEKVQEALGGRASP